MLQSSIEQIYNLQIIHRIRTEAIHNQLHMVSAFGVLAVLVFTERWTGALQVRSRFQTAQIAYQVYFRNVLFIHSWGGGGGNFYP